jgi:hypothetical protein
MAKKLTKYQAKKSEVKPTTYSTDYYNKVTKTYYDISNKVDNAPYGGGMPNEQYEGRKKIVDLLYKGAKESSKDSMRQIHKGQPGFDKDGNPVTAMDMLQRMYSTKKEK